MKRIEEDFLNDANIKTNSTFSDIKEQINFNCQTNNSNFKVKRTLILLSCFILAVALCVSGYFITVDALEYNDAIDFFESNELSSDGLSRREIKLVYKDIKTNSFTYNKTGEVINNSIMLKVPGYVVSSIDPKLQDNKYLWGYFVELHKAKPKENGITYVFYDDYSRYEDGKKIDASQRIVKYSDKDVVWEIDVTLYNVSKIIEFDDCLVAYTDRVFQNDGGKGNLLLIDLDSGEILKVIQYTNEIDTSNYTYISSPIVRNYDKSFTIFSNKRGVTENKLYIITYNKDGELISLYDVEINYRPLSITKFKDGYLILTFDNKFINIDKYGNTLKEYSYESDEYLYYIVDIIEYNDKIFLSTYLVPKEINKSTDSGEVRYAETYYIRNLTLGLPNQTNLTDIFRENYSASLLICDDMDGTPQTFYTINGAIGSSLRINASNELIWEVENIANVKLSIATSSFTYGGITEVYEYKFDSTLKLKDIKDKNEDKVFRR